jgi:hypothetical protein
VKIFFASLLATFLSAGSVLFAKDAAPVLRHVVLFKFKDGTSPEQVEKITKAFAELPKKIDTIKAYEAGTNNSPEGLNQGFTHAFIVTFADEKGREVYLPHPAHKEFVDLLLPSLDKACVVDFWAK